MHNKKHKVKNLATETNSFKIELPDLKDVKIIDAIIDINVTSINTGNSFMVNFSAIKESEILDSWPNVDTIKNISTGQVLRINISDELQTSLERKASHLLLEFIGDQEISFADSESDLNIDYISLSEYQANGNSHKIDIGKNGSASIDLSTGTLSANFPILATDNKPLPLSISANYSSIINEKLLEQNIGLPSGWHLNLNQFLIKEESDEGSLTFKFIDENGKNQIIEEKYYYLTENEEKSKEYVSRKDLSVDLDGKYVFEDKEVLTELVAPSGLKLVSSISDVEGASLVDYEPEELKNLKNQIINISKQKENVEHSLEQNLKQICILTLSKESILKQLDLNKHSLDFNEKYIALQEKIDFIKDAALRRNRQFTHLSDNDSKSSAKNYLKNSDDDTLYIKSFNNSIIDELYNHYSLESSPDIKNSKNETLTERAISVVGTILSSESQIIYSLGLEDNFIGSLENQKDSLNTSKEIYKDIITLEGFKTLITNTCNELNCPQLSDNKIEIFYNIFNDANSTFTLSSKDIVSLDSQIKECCYNIEQYDQELKNIEDMLKKYNHQLKLYEQQVPIHYLYNDSNIIYGFGKTYTENDEETNVYRLILITDAYENTIYISYESLTSNKITSITDSSEKVTSFVYSEDSGLLKEIIDPQDRKTCFTYKDNNLETIIGKTTNLNFTYVTNNETNKVNIENIIGKSKIGAKFSYYNDKVVSVNKISCINEINKDFDQDLLDPYIIPNYHVLFSYDNYKSTTLTNSKDKKITYLFDKYGKVKTVYENDFTITESQEGSSLCESEPIFRSNVTDFNYQDKNTLLKVTKLPYSTDYLENVNFDNTKVQQACSQSGSTEYSHSSLGDDFICGEDTVCCSYLVYHNHYKFEGTNSSASLSLEKTDDNNPFTFLEETCHKMLVLSCWAKADSAFIITDEDSENYSSNSHDRKFELRAVVKYENEENERDPISQSFDWRNTNWQYCSLPIELESSNIEKITFYIDYSDNTNTSSFEFTKPELKLGDFEKTSYNSDKTIVNITTGHSEWEKELKYNDKQQLISETVKRVYVKEGTANEFTTTYEYNKTGKLIKSTDFYGIVKESVYNDKGSVVKTITYHKDEPANILVEENIINDKGETTEEVNEFGEKVLQYEYKDGTNIVTTQIDSNGNKTSFGYDDSDNLVEKTTFVDGEDNTTVYGYTLDFLTSLKHNNFEINYNYYGDGKLKEVYIAGVRYLTKEYNENEEITYLENGESYKTIYNDDGKILQVYYKKDQQTEDWTLTVQNIYDIYGNLIFAEDKITNDLNKYFIDSFGNTYKEESTQHSESIDIENQYDEYHTNIINSSITYDKNLTTKLNYNYTLSDDPNAKLLKVNLDQGVNSEGLVIKNIFEQEIKYDKSNRVNNLSNKICTSDKTLNKEFYYLKYGDHTSNLISTIKYSNDGLVNDRLTYKYDKNGNIIEIRQQGQLLARYKYDSLSRLIREDNQEFKQTTTFEYDGGGNIINKRIYSFTLVDNLDFEFANEIIPYTYPISGWCDQLKQFNGKEIKNYDELGNPWEYLGNTLVWSHGRQLDKFGEIADYQYNTNGLRTKKTVHLEKCCNNNPSEVYNNCEENSDNTFSINYFLNGNKILKQHDCCNDLTFYYGADGITGFHITSENATYEGNNLDHDFFYKKNSQNDIIGIHDQNGKLIIKYYYDAWGNQKAYNAKTDQPLDINNKNNYTNISDIIQFIAIKNPFRYRSYYYDFETGLYYLNSRYYDPQTGRFINADNIDILTKTQDIINGLNLYAYCLNNPVNNIDENGDIPSWLKWLIGGLILIAAVVTIVVTGGAATGLISAIAIGAAKGALVGAGIGLATGITTGLITGDWSGLADSFMWGAIGGAISGGISGGFGFGANAGISIYGDIVKNGIVLGNKLNMSLQIFVSIGTYVGQTLTSGEELSVAGFVFAILGGVAGGTLFKDLASPMIINVLNSLQDIVRNIRKKFLPSEFLDWLM